MNGIHLGGGVYASNDGAYIVLTTNCAKIYLHQEAMTALFRFAHAGIVSDEPRPLPGDGASIRINHIRLGKSLRRLREQIANDRPLGILETWMEMDREHQLACWDSLTTDQRAAVREAEKSYRQIRSE